MWRRALAAAQVFVADVAQPVMSDDDRHHLARVRRLRPGETVVAADGRGRWVSCRFRDGAPGDGALEVDGAVEVENRPGPALTVAFAPAKGDRPEWAVQKLTELGIDTIVVFRAARSVVRWDEARSERAVERLRRVAREAAAQCRQVWLPEVGTEPSMAAIVERLGSRGVGMADPGGSAPSLRCPVLAVGPEGGWSDEERALGAAPIGLGPYILRAETAAVTAGALLGALRAGLVHPSVEPPEMEDSP